MDTGTDLILHNGHRRPNLVTEETRPTANVAAETGTLGGMLLDNDTIDDVAAFLRTEDFYHDAHVILCRAIFDMRGRGMVVDAITLADELTRRGEFASIGGDARLERLLESVPHAASTVYHAQIVKQKAVSRALEEIYDKGRRDIRSNNFTAEELLASAQREIFAITDESAGGKDYAVLADTIGGAVHRIFARQNGQRIEGVATGWPELDDVVGGFRPGQLIYVAARTSMGKTALALNILAHAVCMGKVPTFVSSLEMERDELEDRLLASVAEVDGDKIRALKGLDPTDQQRVIHAAEMLQNAAPVLIDDTPNRNVFQIAAAVRRAKARHRVGLVMIDQIQLIEPENRRESRQLQIGGISRRLKILARETGVPIIVMSQLNRGPEDRDGHRPRISDLRESGDQEQDADIVLLIHRDDYYDKDKNPGCAEVIVAKNRNGRRSDVPMAYISRFMKFIPRAQLANYQEPPRGRTPF